jgi:hypothetical protein
VREQEPPDEPDEANDEGITWRDFYEPAEAVEFDCQEHCSRQRLPGQTVDDHHREHQWLERLCRARDRLRQHLKEGHDHGA